MWKPRIMFELSTTIHQVEARINEESERAKHYLDPTTEEPIVKVKRICVWTEWNIAFPSVSGTSVDQLLCERILSQILLSWQ